MLDGCLEVLQSEKEELRLLHTVEKVSDDYEVSMTILLLILFFRELGLVKQKHPTKGDRFHTPYSLRRAVAQEAYDAHLMQYVDLDEEEEKGDDSEVDEQESDGQENDE